MLWAQDWSTGLQIPLRTRASVYLRGEAILSPRNAVKVTDILLRNGQNDRFPALSQVLGSVMTSGLVHRDSSTWACGARAARGACERSEAALSEAKAQTLRAERSSSERSEGRCTASLPLQSEGAERSEVPERPPEGASTT